VTADRVAAALLAVSVGCAIAGTYLLAGGAWSLIAAAGLGFGMAGLLMRGMSRG
jgi:hypothetical protein